MRGADFGGKVIVFVPVTVPFLLGSVAFPEEPVELFSVGVSEVLF
jgi:hypothetical protein